MFMEKLMRMPFWFNIQCEDDFVRLEMNYIEKNWDAYLKLKGNPFYNDLETRLIIDEKEAKTIMKMQNRG
jgi:hypothetical protein